MPFKHNAARPLPAPSRHGEAAVAVQSLNRTIGDAKLIGIRR